MKFNTKRYDIKKMSFKKLIANSNMTVKEFSDYFSIPFKTVQKWDRGERECTPYLLELMLYKLINEGVIERGCKE